MGVRWLPRPKLSFNIGFLLLALLAACSGGARPADPSNVRAVRTEPPATMTPWQKLEWLQEQMRGASDAQRAELLVRAAELYFSVERPESAGARAREAIYTGGSTGSTASRAHAVLGAIALLRHDLTSARRELSTASDCAVTELDASAVYALLSRLEESAQRPTEAAVYRSRVRQGSDPRIQDLLRPFDEEESPAVAKGPDRAPAVASASRIKIVPRSSWKPNRIGSDTDPMASPRRITVHHEGKEFSGGTLDDTLRQVRAIQDFHQRSRKWADIAYHFIIDPLGNIVEARPLTLQGAHAGEKNKKGESPNSANIGISLLGNFDVQRPTPAQESALRQLVAYLEATYSIPSQELYTHNEIRLKFNIGPTGCPGRNLKPLVEDIRRRGPLAAAPGERPGLGPQ